jgi:hypothetical protein
MYAQLGRLPEWLEYFGSLIRVAEGTVPPFKGPYLNYVKRVPVGVVGQITPWNHPMLIAIKKIAPALAAGNSIVVKPSELAPCTLLEFAQLLKDAGIPDGVFNVVPGFGARAGKALTTHPGLGKLDLTGGTETGRAVMSAAGKNLTSCVMELGGKAPVLVFPDANLTEAVRPSGFFSAARCSFCLVFRSEIKNICIYIYISSCFSSSPSSFFSPPSSFFSLPSSSSFLFLSRLFISFFHFMYFPGKWCGLCCLYCVWTNVHYGQSFDCPRVRLRSSGECLCGQGQDDSAG